MWGAQEAKEGPPCGLKNPWTPDYCADIHESRDEIHNVAPLGAHALTAQLNAHAQAHLMHALCLHGMWLCSWLPAPGQIFTHFSLTTALELGTRMLPGKTLRSADLLETEVGRASRSDWDRVPAPKCTVTSKT